MRQQWVFFQPCGCPFGVLEAVRFPERGAGRALTRSEAWREFYETAAERNTAMDRGVTSELMDHDVYVRDVYPQMLSSAACPHKTAA
ncbi:hypothetical protein ACFFX1_54725 [Dactylosporangium sucinum]|uniref:Uncharacterized protein n=1 Tax=Dactylosporangium sucinum TaxID=1424081 RepID=A0A917U4W7_9ACTN|nr:hypothetical protein [Dactylosporangium sucinum]GGM53703.1 hypothetical protein GCM10007977_064130 [Dactylosporangium sucinum]